jgi:hypothetical protein
MRHHNDGTARLTAGSPWTVDVTTPTGTKRHVLPVRQDAAPPSWADVDAVLFVDGFELMRSGVRDRRNRRLPEPYPLTDGADIGVLRTWEWTERRRIDEGFGNTDDSLLLPLPSGADAEALAEELHAAAGNSPNEFRAERLRRLAERLVRARPSAVLIPSQLAGGLRWDLKSIDPDPDLDPYPGPGPSQRPRGTVRARDLAELIDQARPTATRHPLLHDALREALTEALSHPGAAGIAARDALCEDISHFLALHQTAVRPDDPEQLRIQRERASHPE